ncbi:hypothetical protein QDR69_02480 [Acinetobacter baumannii]|nr:hypothetical protein [Acinetobacter baumannii]MDH2528832.1 hypothetical protein [Acinetobacter baumannii]
MDILKFLRSFNTVGTYLAMATIVLIIMVILGIRI